MWLLFIYTGIKKWGYEQTTSSAVNLCASGSSGKYYYSFVIYTQQA